MMKNWLLILAGICLAILIQCDCMPKKETENQYCHIKSCGNKPHTMCSYPYLYNNTRANCKNPIQDVPPVTFQRMKKILDLHNEIRQSVGKGKETRGLFNQPQPAGIIGNLTWNHELAKIAQRWANQCIDENDQCRDTNEQRIGQNMAKITGMMDPRDLTMDKFIGLWYDEVKNFDPKYVKKFHSDDDTFMNVRNYTQLVWANTKEIGCGFMKVFVSVDKTFSGTLVCNYGPTGNINGEQVYQTL